MIKSRKGLSGVERRKGVCYQWKDKGQCSKGDQCSFQHESNDRAPKPRTQPHHEVEVCLGREVSEAKVTTGPFFDNCADVI